MKTSYGTEQANNWPHKTLKQTRDQSRSDRYGYSPGMPEPERKDSRAEDSSLSQILKQPRCNPYPWKAKSSRWFPAVWNSHCPTSLLARALLKKPDSSTFQTPSRHSEVMLKNPSADISSGDKVPYLRSSLLLTRCQPFLPLLVGPHPASPDLVGPNILTIVSSGSRTMAKLPSGELVSSAAATTTFFIANFSARGTLRNQYSNG